jgi:hypothetical protein
MRSAVKFQLETQKTTQRHKRTWKYVIKIYLNEIVCDDLVWTYVNQWWDVVNMVINLRVTQKVVN